MALTTFGIPQSWNDLVIHDGLPVGESAANMHALCASIGERYGAIGANPPFTPPCLKGRMPSWDLACQMMDALRALYAGLPNKPRYLDPVAPYTPREAEYAEGYEPDYRWRYDNSVGIHTWLNEVRLADLDAADRNCFAAMPARGAPARDWSVWMLRMKNAVDFLHVREVGRLLKSEFVVRASARQEDASNALGTLQSHVAAGEGHYSPRAGIQGRYFPSASPQYSERSVSYSPGGEYRLWLLDDYPTSLDHGGGGSGEIDIRMDFVLGVRDAWPAYASARLKLLRYERQYGTYSVRHPGPYTPYQNRYDDYNYIESEHVSEINCGVIGPKSRASVESEIGITGPAPHVMPVGDEVGDIHSVTQQGEWKVEGFLDFGISGGFRYFDAPATT